MRMKYYVNTGNAIKTRNKTHRPSSNMISFSKFSLATHHEAQFLNEDNSPLFLNILLVGFR